MSKPKYKFKVEIDISNDSFSESAWPELARIFEKLAGEMRNDHCSVNLLDANGNKVGTVGFEEFE